MFINNYFEELPDDIKCQINTIKKDSEELEKRLKVGDMFMYNDTKYKIIRVNKRSYRLGVVPWKRYDPIFIKGDSVEESKQIIELVFLDDKIKKEYTISKTKIEKECVRINPTSECFEYRMLPNGLWQVEDEYYRYD